MYRTTGLFLLTLTASAVAAAAQPLTFTRADSTSSAGARAIAVADFDRNGRLDLAHANTGRNSVSILLNHLDGRIVLASDIPVGTGPFAMTTADFNRDGIADLAVANADADSISLLFGKGDGSFSRRDIAARGNPRAIAASDVTGDGIPDLIYTGYLGNLVIILTNDGRGQFTAESGIVGYAFRPQGVTIADFNRDGQRDIAVAYESDGGVGLFYLAGGRITGVTPVAGMQNINLLASGDLNADGWIDLVAASTWHDRVGVYLNSAAGFVYKRSYAAGAWPGGLALEDVNHDGALDILTANRSSSTVNVLAGDRLNPGAFLARQAFSAGNGSRALAVADFNADGRIDVATGNQFAETVTILSNATAFVRAAFSFHRQTLGEPYQYGPGQDVWPADFDRNGTMDVAVVNRAQDGIAVVLTGKPEVALPTPDSLERFGAGDFNGDGSVDLVALIGMESGDYNMRIASFVNDGTGSFAAPAPAVSPLWTGAYVIADMNRDGRDDLVVTGYDRWTRERVIEVHGGNRDGTLARLTRTVVGEEIASMAVGDVNRDGKLDVVALPGPALWLGDGAGGLVFARTFDMPAAIDLQLADMNRDGYLDLVLIEVYHVYVALGTPDGFSAANSFPLEIPGHIGDYEIAIADLDLDGNLDVVTKGANLLRGNGDGTLAAADRFDYFGFDVKVADFNRDGLPDIVILSNQSRPEIMLNERNQVNHPPAVRMPNATFTYDQVLRECQGVYAEGGDPDLHFVQWELRDESGAIVSPEGGLLACGGAYGTYRFTWKAWDGRGAVVTGTFTITYVPTKEIVLHTWINEDGIMGNWTPVYDTTAAGGLRFYDPNLGAPKVTAPLAQPGSYYELPFIADPTQTYKLWIRLKADNNSWANDSLWVQFSGATDVAGTPRYRIGTAEGLAVNLEECVNCGVSGWGWEDDGWGAVNRNGVLLRFPAGGEQKLRIQTREDGVSIDQIVLSAETYLATRPGTAKNDRTILVASPR